MTMLMVGVGGALGAVSRYYLSAWVNAVAGESVPWGTFTVNVVGSFALGLLLVWLQEVTPNEQARQFAAIGVLGSFTTFSTFSHETVALAHAGEVVRAGGYALGSVFIGVVAVMLGVSLATAIAGARG
jgi:CrcB protein